MASAARPKRARPVTMKGFLPFRSLQEPTKGVTRSLAPAKAPKMSPMTVEEAPMPLA